MGRPVASFALQGRELLRWKGKRVLNRAPYPFPGTLRVPEQGRRKYEVLLHAPSGERFERSNPFHLGECLDIRFTQPDEQVGSKCSDTHVPVCERGRVPEHLSDLDPSVARQEGNEALLRLG